MSYIEERFKNIERAKRDPKMAELIAKATAMPLPEPEYRIRPKYLSAFVHDYCQWVGHKWRESNLRREHSSRVAELEALAVTEASA